MVAAAASSNPQPNWELLSSLPLSPRPRTYHSSRLGSVSTKDTSGTNRYGASTSRLHRASIGRHRRRPAHRWRSGNGWYGYQMPTQLAKPRAPSGTSAIPTTLRPVAAGWFSWLPIRMAASAHKGVASSQSTMFLPSQSRCSAAGSASAAMLRAGSDPRRLVAVTSAYIQMARTIANASGPWKRKSASTAAGGSNVQHAAMSRPLPSTTPAAVKGGCRATRHSCDTASRTLTGSRAVDSAIRARRDSVRGPAAPPEDQTEAAQQKGHPEQADAPDDESSCDGGGVDAAFRDEDRRDRRVQDAETGEGQRGQRVADEQGDQDGDD